MEFWEHPPSTQITSMAGPLGGDAEDLGAPTINVKNVDSGLPGRRGGSGLHLGSKRCVVNLHGYQRQKVILLMGPTFTTPGPTMAYDP
jgi:hypothetical protein